MKIADIRIYMLRDIAFKRVLSCFVLLVSMHNCAKLENTPPVTGGGGSSGLTEAQKESLRQTFYTSYAVKCADTVEDYDGTEIPGFEKTKSFGPPLGGGQNQGSLDVFVLGDAKSAVFSVAGYKITNQPGADFKVFENGFEISGSPGNYSWDLGWVEISFDKTNWYGFPVSYSGSQTQPAGKSHLAGLQPVGVNYQNNSIDPRLNSAGGDAFDISQAGKITNRADGNPLNFTIDYGQTISEVRYIRIFDGASHLIDGQISSNGIDIDSVCAFNFASLP